MTLRADIEDLRQAAKSAQPTDLLNYSLFATLLTQALEDNQEPEPEYEYGVYAEGINYRVHPCASHDIAKQRAAHYRAVPSMYGMVKLMRRAKPHTWEDAPE